MKGLNHCKEKYLFYSTYFTVTWGWEMSHTMPPYKHITIANVLQTLPVKMFSIKYVGVFIVIINAGNNDVIIWLDSNQVSYLCTKPQDPTDKSSILTPVFFLSLLSDILYKWLCFNAEYGELSALIELEIQESFFKMLFTLCNEKEHTKRMFNLNQHSKKSSITLTWWAYRF